MIQGMNPAGRRFAGWLVFACLLVFGMKLAAEETRLVWIRQPGDVDRQKFTRRLQVQATPPDRNEPFVTSIEQACVVESKVLRVSAEGDAELDQRFEQIALALKMPLLIAKTIEIDTANPSLADDKPELELLQSINKFLSKYPGEGGSEKEPAGPYWLTTVNRRAQIQQLVSSESMVELMNEIGSMARLADTFSAPGLQRMMEQPLIPLPEGPVEQGDEWEQVVVQPLAGGELTTKRICRYIGPVEDGLERIAIDMTAEFQPPQKTRFPTELIKQEGNGEAFFAPETGRLVKTQLLQKLELKVDTPKREALQKVEIFSEFGPAPILDPPEPEIGDKD